MKEPLWGYLFQSAGAVIRALAVLSHDIRAESLNATISCRPHQKEKSLIMLITEYMEQARDEGGILTAPLILSCINTGKELVSSRWCRDMSHTPHHRA
jgi:hypothetical protein